MKALSLFTLLVLAVFHVGCTDQVAGPDLDTENTTLSSLEHAAKGSRGLADLSLRMHASTRTAAYNDSLLLKVNVHNNGPADASGLSIAYNDSLLNVLSASTSSTTGGYNDSLGVWIVGHLPSGATETLVLTVQMASAKPATAMAEIATSDVRDPDSIPGDGDPRQDDYASVKIMPDVPLCPDCPTR